MNWLPEERETILRFDFVKNCWFMCTNIKKHYTRARRCNYTLRKEEINDDGKFIYAEFEVPFEKAICFRNRDKLQNKLNQISDIEDEEEED